MQNPSLPFQTATSMSSDPPMDPPPVAVYSSLDELLVGGNNWAVAHGYKLVVVRSKTNAAGQKTWVHLACDRHGTKRNTHNLTPETRKKNRRSRRCECPMYCVASKQQNDLWELQTRHGGHNHGAYEPPQPKKKDIPKPHASEVVNLPALQTPSNCTADFCLIPIGTGSASVANEIAEVQRLLKRTGLNYSMHSSGTTLEGSWDDVTRFIGQAHSLLHGSGVVRIQTHMSIGSRTDKKQGFQDKVDAVNAILDGIPRADLHGGGDENVLGSDDEDTMNDPDHSMDGDPNIQPGLDSHRIMGVGGVGHLHAPMTANMGVRGTSMNNAGMDGSGGMGGSSMRGSMGGADMTGNMGGMGHLQQQMMHNQHDVGHGYGNPHTPQHMGHGAHPLSHSMNMH